MIFEVNPPAHHSHLDPSYVLTAWRIILCSSHLSNYISRGPGLASALMKRGRRDREKERERGRKEKRGNGELYRERGEEEGRGASGNELA